MIANISFGFVVGYGALHLGLILVQRPQTTMEFGRGLYLFQLMLFLIYLVSAPVYTFDLKRDINGAVDVEDEEPRFVSSEQKLMYYLVGDYDSSVRPVYDAMEPVDVKLGLTLTQILDLDEKNQVLTVNVWLEAEWFDERLNWSSSDFGGLSSVRIPCHKLWLPDIVLYNSVDDYTSGYMPSLAMVYNTSRVFWGPVIRFRSSCKIDITFFPFDTQICKLKMGSWAYTGLEVNVWNSSETMDLSNFVDNGEWELLGVAVQRNVVFYNCCEEPFPDVTFSIQLRRRTKYYFMNIIIPCIILSFLCLGGFLLPPESGEKITLGLSVLLTITVFMLMVADKMPQTSESISVISIYLMVVLATSCLSVLSSVLVLSIHHQRGRPSRAPSWLRKLCFSVVGPLMCIRRHTDDPQPGEIITTSVRGKPRQNFKRESRFRTSSKIASTEDEWECMRLDHTGESDRCDRGDVTNDPEKMTHGNHTYQQVYMPRSQATTTYHTRHQQYKPSYTPFQQQVAYAPKQEAQMYAPRQHGTTAEFCEVIQSDSSFSDSIEHSGTAADHVTSEGSQEESADQDATRKGSRAERTYNLVVRYLINLIQTRQEDEVRDEEVFKEWHDIAFVLDRLFFYFFVIITLISTVTILEMRPAVRTI